jgi:hypothetical protein
MNKFGSHVLMVSALCLVSACKTTTLPTFQERLDDADALLVKLETLPDTLPSEMPFSGSATYDGQSVISYCDDCDLTLGRATIVANFANGTISGQLDQFVDESWGDMNGSLILSNGQIFEASISVDVSGQLTGTFNGDPIDAEYFATLSGGFAGFGPDMVVAFGEGGWGLDGEYQGSVTIGLIAD